MPLAEIWATPSGAEVTIESRWPRPPVVTGAEADRATVLSLLERLGPYSDPVTIPEIDAEFKAILESEGFAKAGLLRRPDTAAELLRAAVRQCEESVRQHLELLKWQAERDAETANDDVETLDFVFVSLYVDRALEASRIAVILAVASAEAFINQVAIEELGVWEEEDRLSILAKWVLVARHLSAADTFDRGANPYQAFRASVRLRDGLIHPKPAPDRFDLDDVLPALLGRPDWDASVTSGREACLAVRAMHLEFARLTGRECPSWVGVVPPAPAEDLKVWRSAAMLHGTREDPDFPKEPPDTLPIPLPSGD